jgi:Fe-S-cluster containining protein
VRPPGYPELLTRLDAWFAEGVKRYGATVPCTAGCTACCHGPFDISPADAALLAEGIAALDAPARNDIRARSEALLARMAALAPGWGAPWDVNALGDEAFDRVAEALADEPCPMLGAEGRCRVYAHRPLVCRLIGLPMETDRGEVLPNACPIQDRFPGYAELAPVPFDYSKFADEEERLLAALPGPWTTIAAVGARGVS